MSDPTPTPLPPSGFAADVLAKIAEVPASSSSDDPNRLVKFVQTVASPVHASEPKPEPMIHLVAFRLGDELYAAPVERVVEIIRVQELTRVPQAPDHVRGVQNLRGSILPVLEVKTRLGLPKAILTPESRTMVVEGHERLVGLLVDSVVQVIRVPRSYLEPPPPEVRSRCSEYVVGIAKIGGRMALMLDLDKLLLLPKPITEEVAGS
jgi:purine-binding chemotaxis protein CheW